LFKNSAKSGFLAHEFNEKTNLGPMEEVGLPWFRRLLINQVTCAKAEKGHL
jgi:hypothetical protein